MGQGNISFNITKIFKDDKFWFISILIFGAALRFCGIFNDLWLDEILSFESISKLNYPIQIFTKFFSDNNHPLNSLFMYLVGKDNPGFWFKYRILSFLSGVGTIIMVYIVSLKMFKSSLWRLILALTVSLSFPLVVYSSEARGFSLAVFFSILSFCILTKYLKKESPRTLFYFQISFILGFLSHFSFFYISVGLFTMASFQLFGRKLSLGNRLAYILKLFMIPAFVVFILCGQLSFNLRYYGGQPYSLFEIITEAFGFIIGYPEGFKYAYIIVILAFFILMLELFFLSKESSDLGIFSLGVIFAICMHLILVRPGFYFFRYFLCFLPFLMILLIHFFSRFAGSNIARVLLFGLIIAWILAFNTKEIISFLRFGRGNYMKALSYMHKNTISSSITVTSDHHFGNLSILNFYNSFFKDGKKIVYVPLKEAYRKPADWCVTHSAGENPRIPEYIKLNKCFVYMLKKHYPYNGSISGFHWFLYQKKNLCK